MKDESSFDIDNKTNPVQTVAPTNKEENEMIGATDKITALYCRLSVEDTKDDKKKGNEDPSDSIQHQQLMLMQYAKSNRFPNPTVFIYEIYRRITVSKHHCLSQIYRFCLSGCSLRWRWLHRGIFISKQYRKQVHYLPPMRCCYDVG